MIHTIGPPSLANTRATEPAKKVTTKNMKMQPNNEAIVDLIRDTRLAGQTAVVTGSTSGIGEAIAHVLAASGAEVLVTGRDEDRAQEVVDAIRRTGGTAHAMTVDLGGSPAELRSFAEKVRTILGGHIDILVNNAGVYPMGATESLSDEHVEAILAINIRAPHALVGAFAPGMADRSRGAIVNIGSWTARVGIPLSGLYASSKAALEQLTRSWAAEYGPRGIRVNTVSPGVTATPGNDSAADIITAISGSTVAGQPVRPIDIAFAVRFAVSDEATFLHGSAIDVDGGITNARLG